MVIFDPDYNKSTLETYSHWVEVALMNFEMADVLPCIIREEESP